MSWAAILAELGVDLVAELVKRMPSAPGDVIEVAVADVIDAIKTKHPEIGDAPPDPEKQAIDEEIDAELAALKAKK